MANFFTAQVKGLNSVISRNNSFLQTIKNKSDELLNKTANKIEGDAKALCKVSSIAETIATVVNGQNDYEIDAGQGLADPDIAAYLNFGTGFFAKQEVSGLPQDWKDYAWTFKKQKDGRMPAAPYLTPAFFSNTVNTVKDISNIITDAGR